MPRLSVPYMGLELPTPIIVSSCSLTNTIGSITRAANAGAGAVVLKSLFEEQIEHDSQADQVDMGIHPEAEEYVRQMSKHLGPSRYLELIREAKQTVEIPIIASVNCVSNRWWGDYGRQLESSGADAIELNMAIMPRSDNEGADEIESRYLRIVDKVRRNVSVPIAAKIGPYFTSLPQFASRLREAGASALVLFNRFYQLDIDTEKMELAPGYQYSSPHEIHTSLRWTSILSGMVGCDIAASTGVHDGDGVIKLLLAGAAAVQVSSALYLKGMDTISEMVSTLSSWMDQKGFAEIQAFQGTLSQDVSEHPERYERLQYIKALTGLS
jgi:dihydroorotate dehydrogenase (fumarate)